MVDLSWLDKVWCNYQGKAAAQAGPPTACARREGDRGMLSRGSGWLSPAGGDEEIFYSRLDGGGLNPAFAGVTIKEAGVTNEKREKGPGMTFLRGDDKKGSRYGEIKKPGLDYRVMTAPHCHSLPGWRVYRCRMGYRGDDALPGTTPGGHMVDIELQGDDAPHPHLTGRAGSSPAPTIGTQYQRMLAPIPSR